MAKSKTQMLVPIAKWLNTVSEVFSVSFILSFSPLTLSESQIGLKSADDVRLINWYVKDGKL